MKRMEAFLDFFEAMPSWQKLVWIVACMSINLVVEGVRPLFQGGFRSWKHTRTNLTFLGTTMAINSAFGAASVGVFAWAATNEVGLLHLFEAPTWVELIVAIVVFDLIAQYGVHWCLHNRTRNSERRRNTLDQSCTTKKICLNLLKAIFPRYLDLNLRKSTNMLGAYAYQ